MKLYQLPIVLKAERHPMFPRRVNFEIAMEGPTTEVFTGEWGL